MITTPYALNRLDDLRMQQSRVLQFDGLDLCEIAEGMNLDQHAELLLDGSYMAHLLPRFAWWIEVAKALANGRVSEFRPDTADAAFNGGLDSLVNSVLTAFAPALADTADLAGLSQTLEQTAGLELLCRYWRFTQAIRAKALEIWPEEDLAWLWATA